MGGSGLEEAGKQKPGSCFLCSRKSQEAGASWEREEEQGRDQGIEQEGQGTGFEVSCGPKPQGLTLKEKAAGEESGADQVQEGLCILMGLSDSSID